MGAGVVVAILLSAAALVVTIVRDPGTTTPPASATASTVSAPVGDTSGADKALCEKVGPLLREVVDDGHSFVALGDPGTPERDAGIPAFRAQIENWAARIQPILDTQNTPLSYLARTLQTEVDFKRLYASNLRPGPEMPTDSEAWNVAAIAHGGPYEVCHGLGVTW